MTHLFPVAMAEQVACYYCSHSLPKLMTKVYASILCKLSKLHSILNTGRQKLPEHANKGKKNSGTAQARQQEMTIKNKQETETYMTSIYRIGIRKPNLIGGGADTSITTQDNSSQAIMIPLETVEPSPIIKASVLTNFSTISVWKPEYQLQYRAPTHPLDLTIPTSTREKIKEYCQQPSNAVILYSKQRPNIVVTSSDLRNLM